VDHGILSAPVFLVMALWLDSFLFKTFQRALGFKPDLNLFAIDVFDVDIRNYY